MKFLCLFSVVLFFNLVGHSQSFFPKTNYPQNIFSYPVKIPVSLAGNYGECRPNHFHSGLDIRTNQQENIPLFSIGNGYIARVSISEKGFGNCLYINHPGGFTSVYAHCNLFFGSLASYVKEQQYKQKKWAVDIQIAPHLFPVRKGTYIGRSGNTGSSQAPHLHLEIRNTKTEKTLNGLLFFNKMADTKKPVISRLAIYDGAKSIYEQEPQVYNAMAKGGFDVPSTADIKTSLNQVYFGVQANDYMENSLRLGVYQLLLMVDNKAVFGWQLNRIGYDETRYMNAIGDYRTKLAKGFWLQLAHKLPNDHLDIYTSTDNKNGLVDLRDGLIHTIRIRVYDVKGNKKDLVFTIQGNASAKKTEACGDRIRAGELHYYQSDKIAFKLNKLSLYDYICLRTKVSESSQPYSFLYGVHNSSVPVHDYFMLSLKPKQAIPQNLHNKLAFKYWPDSKEENTTCFAAVYDKGWVKAKVRAFGNYEIIIDQDPPTVQVNLKENSKLYKGSRIILTADDKISFIKEVTVDVDGQWLCFAQRRHSYSYIVDEHFPVGNHTLTFKATDDNGNTVVKKMKVHRK